MLEEHIQGWYAQGVQLGVQQGIEQGIRQGIELGIQQSKLEGIREYGRRNIIMILEVRFGELPASVIAQINAITEIDVLTHYSKQAILIDSLASFSQLLTNPSTQMLNTEI